MAQIIPSVRAKYSIVKEVRKTSDIPICLMTYLNPVFHYGYDKFFKKCQEAGVDGIIIPDCPFEESKEVSDIYINNCTSNNHSISKI